MLSKKSGKNLLLAIMIICIIIIAIIVIKELMMKLLYKKEYAEYVTKYSQEYGVDKNLIYALIKAESNFEPHAVSTSNAKGLMQLMYTTAKEIAEKNNIEITEEKILEPEINIRLGIQYISELIEKYQCVELALAAYNAGIGNVDKWIENGIIKEDGTDVENIPYKETNTYIRKVMRDYKIYSNILEF